MAGRLIRAAQVGTGGWGKNHARVLSEIGALAAICDSDESRRAEFASKYSVPGYASVSEMIESQEFDAALVCTPTTTHVDVAAELISAKKHVFVEKPMTYAASDGQKLADMAKKAGVILTCGYIERFNPGNAVVKRMTSSGDYGQLVKAEFLRVNRLPVHIRDVGIIYDTMVHDIDTAMWLFGQAPEMVFARAGSIRHDHEDFATIMLGFSENRMALLLSNWLTPVRLRKMHAFCTESTISFDMISQEIAVKGSDRQAEPHEKTEPLLEEIKSFLSAAESGSEPAVTAKEAISVTRIAEAALLSSQKGTPIYLDLK